MLIDCNKGYDNKQYIKDETYKNAMEATSNKLKIFSTHFVHFGCGIGLFEMELKQVEPQYIKNIGNWKPETQDGYYSSNRPIKKKR